MILKKLAVVMAITIMLQGCAVHVGILENSAMTDERPVICAPCVTTFVPFPFSSRGYLRGGLGVGFDYGVFPWFVYIFGWNN